MIEVFLISQTVILGNRLNCSSYLSKRPFLVFQIIFLQLHPVYLLCLSAADSSISTSFMRLLLFLLSHFVSDNGFGSRGIFLLCIGIGSSPGNTYFLEVICIGEQGEFEFVDLLLDSMIRKYPSFSIDLSTCG